MIYPGPGQSILATTWSTRYIALELANAGAVPDLTVAGSNLSLDLIQVMHRFASKIPCGVIPSTRFKITLYS